MKKNQIKQNPVLLLIVLLLTVVGCSKDENINTTPPDALPDINAATFSEPTNITIPYYGPAANQTYIYVAGEVGKAPEEEVRINRKVATKVVMGIECIIHRDIVYLNGIVIEDTDDWLAQDDDGNLWYLGEFVINNKDNGQFANNDGSWEAGVDGALPGYWFPGNPTVGQFYYQEWYAGEAEDYAEVVAVNETVTIGMGTYTDCIKTKDINPSEPDEYEFKYYAPGIGMIKEELYEDDVLTEIGELVEIIEN